MVVGFVHNTHNMTPRLAQGLSPRREQHYVLFTVADIPPVLIQVRYPQRIVFDAVERHDHVHRRILATRQRIVASDQ